jgi:amino acid transporter
MEPTQAAPSSRLRANCLSFSELLAQAIALISPTMTAALIIPVMFSNTANFSWLSYALGTVMLLFVALNLNQFARRTAGVGSMYAYVCRGLGLTAGGIAGWSLIWAYSGIAMAGVTGFAVFGAKLLADVGIEVSPIILFAVCVATAAYCAWKNVQLSAMVMLLLEGLSMLLITGLCIVVLAQHHFALDTTQFAFGNASFSNMGLGVVVAIFSLVGFECATAFGEEAKNPLRSIPKAVIWSLLISGIFFVFVTYAMVYGVHDYKTPLDQIDAPLNVLAEIVHLKFLQIPLSLAALLSFFSLCMSCINAGSRVVYAMSQHGLFHASAANTHATNETPHVAVAIMAIGAFLVPTLLVIAHQAPLDIFNYVGTLAAFGFLVPYFLITIAAPVYLKHLNQLRARDKVICMAALVLLLIPAIGSVYPVPAAPVKYFPYLFLVYIVLGALWISSFYRRVPTASGRVKQALVSNHEHYQNVLPAGVERV